MDRREFIVTSTLGSLGIYSGILLLNLPNMSELLAPPPIISKSIEGIKVHCLTLGFVKVKRSHKNPGLGMSQILLDPFWTEWLPIHSWVIEHSEGIIVIDTGENVMAKQKNYYAPDGMTGFVNRKILKFNIERSWEIDEQLKKINIHPDDVSKVILTHLHLDHTDGLKYFPKSEILVSKIEWNHPFGAMPQTFPKWLRPNKIEFNERHSIFAGIKNVTQDGKVFCLSTPGHANGHMSVGLRVENMTYFFAGDTSFTQDQLLCKKVAGICLKKRVAKTTLTEIINYAKNQDLIYLPSHDPESQLRFKNNITVY